MKYLKFTLAFVLGFLTAVVVIDTRTAEAGDPGAAAALADRLNKLESAASRGQRGGSARTSRTSSGDLDGARTNGAESVRRD